MGVPLIVNGRVIGLLNLTKQQTSFYGLQHINIVIAFANQAASAIENARLYDQMKAEKQKLSHRVLERTKELAEANEQLKVLDRLKTKFVNDVSHELSTPVGNIQLYLGLIKEGQPEKQASYIATLSEQVNRLEKLIKSILDLSRLDVDTVRPKMAHVNIIEMVTPIVTSLRLRAENVGLSFDFHSNGHQPLVLGDLNQLTQVVTNLVMNAINYTNRGCVNILINYDEAQHQVYLVVKDTGIGIAQKDLPYLFDRFYRGQAVSQANYPGTGLGLAIVKEIVDKHGGQVGVESVLGEGSTFQVALPCVRVL
jgi:signal transduction histidine kinase